MENLPEILNGAEYKTEITKAKYLPKSSHRSKSLMIVSSTSSKLEEVDGSMIPNENMKQVVDLDGAEYKSRIVRKSEKMCRYQQFEYDGKKQIEGERPTDGNVGRSSAGAQKNSRSTSKSPIENPFSVKEHTAIILALLDEVAHVKKGHKALSQSDVALALSRMSNPPFQNRSVKSIQRQIQKWSEPAKSFYEKSHKDIEEPSEDVLVAAARYGATYASVAF